MEPSANPQVLGRRMMYVAWAFAIFLCTLYFDGFLEQRENPNQSPQAQRADGAIEVVLQRNRYGHYVASGTINNVTVTFFLDTGATGIDIPEHVAREIGLTKGTPFEVSTANGAALVYATKLRSVNLGGISMENLSGSINPNTDSDQILLGMRFLKHLEFSQKGDQLTLRQDW